MDDASSYGQASGPFVGASFDVSARAGCRLCRCGSRSNKENFRAERGGNCKRARGAEVPYPASAPVQEALEPGVLGEAFVNLPQRQLASANRGVLAPYGRTPRLISVLLGQTVYLLAQNRMFCSKARINIPDCLAIDERFTPIVIFKRVS